MEFMKTSQPLPFTALTYHLPVRGLCQTFPIPICGPVGYLCDFTKVRSEARNRRYIPTRSWHHPTCTHNAIFQPPVGGKGGKHTWQKASKLNLKRSSSLSLARDIRNGTSKSSLRCWLNILSCPGCINLFLLVSLSSTQTKGVVEVVRDHLNRTKLEQLKQQQSASAGLKPEKVQRLPTNNPNQLTARQNSVLIRRIRIDMCQFQSKTVECA